MNTTAITTRKLLTLSLTATVFAFALCSPAAFGASAPPPPPAGGAGLNIGPDGYFLDIPENDGGAIGDPDALADHAPPPASTALTTPADTSGDAAVAAFLQAEEQADAAIAAQNAALNGEIDVAAPALEAAADGAALDAHAQVQNLLQNFAATHGLVIGEPAAQPPARDTTNMLTPPVFRLLNPQHPPTAVAGKPVYDGREVAPNRFEWILVSGPPPLAADPILDTLTAILPTCGRDGTLEFVIATGSRIQRREMNGIQTCIAGTKHNSEGPWTFAEPVRASNAKLINVIEISESPGDKNKLILTDRSTGRQHVLDCTAGTLTTIPGSCSLAASVLPSHFPPLNTITKTHANSGDTVVADRHLLIRSNPNRPGFEELIVFPTTEREPVPALYGFPPCFGFTPHGTLACASWRNNVIHCVLPHIKSADWVASVSDQLDALRAKAVAAYKNSQDHSLDLEVNKQNAAVYERICRMLERRIREGKIAALDLDAAKKKESGQSSVDADGDDDGTEHKERAERKDISASSETIATAKPALAKRTVVTVVLRPVHGPICQAVASGESQLFDVARRADGKPSLLASVPAAIQNHILEFAYAHAAWGEWAQVVRAAIEQGCREADHELHLERLAREDKERTAERARKNEERARKTEEERKREAEGEAKATSEPTASAAAASSATGAFNWANFQSVLAEIAPDDQSQDGAA